MNAISTLTFQESDAALKAALLDKNWPRCELLIRQVINAVAERLEDEIVPRKYDSVPVKPKRSVFPILYLPVEIKTREWAAKLSLAESLAKKGFSVVIGQSWAVQRNKYHGWPPGIVLFKTLNSIDALNMGGAIGNGHLIAAIDEEAFARPATVKLCQINTDPWAAACADLICVQGKDHAAALSKVYPEAREKIRVTGNPRVKSIAEVNPTPPIPPGYALICSMAGCINNLRGFSTCTYSTLQLTAFGNLEVAKNDYLDCCMYELEMMDRIINEAHSASLRYPKVVLRPHPMEGHELWEKIFANLPRVMVRNEGPVQWWMQHAGRVSVIENCGCQMEAKTIGKPVQVLSGKRHKFPDFGDEHLSPGDAVERIAQEIVGLYEANGRTDPIPHIGRKSGFMAKAFHRNKFPVTPVREVELPGLSVSEIEENVFMVKA